MHMNNLIGYVISYNGENIYEKIDKDYMTLAANNCVVTSQRTLTLIGY